jgi:hypothetical protein
VTVEAWVCDYTAGEVGPSTAITPRFVGTAFGTINPGQSVDVTVDTWTPTHAQATTNGGHVCLGANCWAGDAGNPSDGRPTPPGGHLSYCCDSHCGQLNLQVTALAFGKMGHMFMGMNGGAKGLNARIRMLPAKGRVFGATERTVIRDSRALHDALSPAQLKRFKPFRSRLRPAGFAIAGRGVEPGESIEISLKPKEKRKLDLQVEASPNERPGAVQVFDVITTDADGETLGGARLLAVVV